MIRSENFWLFTNVTTSRKCWQRIREYKISQSSVFCFFLLRATSCIIILILKIKFKTLSVFNSWHYVASEQSQQTWLSIYSKNLKLSLRWNLSTLSILSRFTRNNSKSDFNFCFSIKFDFATSLSITLSELQS